MDLGCGTGRVFRCSGARSVRTGVVFGVDATPEMLGAVVGEGPCGNGGAGARGRDPSPRRGRLGSTRSSQPASSPTPRIPRRLLRALAQCTKPGGRLAVFHPIGRVALARRHHRELRPDELLDPGVLPGVLAANGWRTESIDDAEHRYLAAPRRLDECALEVIPCLG